MTSIVEQALNFLYGEGLVSFVVGWMSDIFDTLIEQFETEGIVSKSITLFGAIAGSLLVIYFFMDLMEKATMDMITLEKLLLAFLKLIVSFAIILNLNDIMAGFVKAGQAFWELAQDESLITTTDGSIINITLPEDTYKGISNVISHFMAIIVSLLIWLAGFVIKIMCMFLCTTNALDIIVRGIFSPIAVADFWSEGRRSAGVRYLKKFLGACMLMAGMIVILRASTILTVSLVDAQAEPILGCSLADFFANLPTDQDACADKIDDLFTLNLLIYSILPSVAGVGAMMGAKNIINDVVGA